MQGRRPPVPQAVAHSQAEGALAVGDRLRNRGPAALHPQPGAPAFRGAGRFVARVMSSAGYCLVDRGARVFLCGTLQALRAQMDLGDSPVEMDHFMPCARARFLRRESRSMRPWSCIAIA